MSNKGLKKHINAYMKKGMRYDGRKFTEYRPVSIDYDISGTAEGSARVKIGGTEVIAGVKMSLEKPFPDTPEEGVLMVNAELLPMSNPEFESGPPEIRSIELARVVDRGIRESKTLDNKKLCLVKGEKVWTVMVDICTINDEGNLLDAAALAAMAAIKNARFPKYDGEKVDYKKKTDTPLPYKKVPIAVTVLKIGDNFVVDPSLEEEEATDVRLTVTSIEDGTICALQKGGDLALSLDEVKKMVELGLEKAKELRAYLI